MAFVGTVQVELSGRNSLRGKFPGFISGVFLTRKCPGDFLELGNIWGSLCWGILGGGGNFSLKKCPGELSGAGVWVPMQD